MIKWTIILIVLLGEGVAFIQSLNCSFSSLCSNTTNDYNFVQFNGNPKSTIETCNCPIAKYSLLLSEQLCFCTNVTTSTSTSECSISTCNTDSQECELDSYLLKNSTSRFSFQIPNEETMFTQEETIIRAIEDKVGELTQYAFQFDDRTKLTYTNNNQINHTFLTPGYHILKGHKKDCYSSTVKAMTWINVASRTKQVYFDVPKSYETHLPMKGEFIIFQGSNLTIKVEIILTIDGIDNSTKIELKADVPIYGFGAPSDVISTTALTSLPSQNISLFITNEIVITETGCISGVDILATKAGVLFLTVLRPVCPVDQIYCYTEQKCGCIDKEILMGKNSGIKPGSLNNLQFDVNITQYILINISKTGYDHVNIQTRNIIVQKGDLIGYIQSSDYASISELPSQVGNQVKQLNIKNEQITINTTLSMKMNEQVYSNKTLALRIFVSKPFTLNLTQEAQAKKGTVTYIATISNHTTTKVTDAIKIPIQERIEGLQFIAGRPKTSDQGAYPKSDLWYEMAVSITAGTNVMYMFRISALNLSANITTTDKYSARTEFNITQAGKYLVEVFAWNNINEMRAAVNFSILNEIKSSQVISKPIVKIDEDFKVSLNISGGSDVKIEVDFGDGTIKRESIENAELTAFYNFTHRYTKCKEFNISSKVSNNVSGPYSSYVLVKSTCLLSYVNLTSFPTPAQSNFVLLSRSDSIEIEIRLNSGSWPVYTIFWGDGGENLIEDYQSEPYPTVFRKLHQYMKDGLFKIFVRVENEINIITSKEVNVNVSGCTAPAVIFNYGTTTKPFILTIGGEMQFNALYDYGKEECKEIVKSQLKFENWTLTRKSDSYVETQVIPEDAINLGKVVYRMQTNSKQPGKYELILKMIYNEEIFTYTAYLEFIRSSLIAKIQNGDLLSIGLRKVLYSEDGKTNNATYYNFTLNAAISYDPDNLKSKIQNFEWYCKVLSNKSLIENSRLFRATVNRTYTERCKSTNFEKLNLMEYYYRIGEITFNTEMFLEDIEYAFRVNISEGERKASAIQKITFLPGSPPNIEIKCIANCRQKVNTMERLVQKYECKDCPITPSVVGNWNITDESGTDITFKLFNKSVSPTGSDKPNLVINPNFFQGNMTYTLLLTVGYSDSTVRSKYTISITTCTKPTGGTCEISPKIGTASKTEFKIRCYDWINFDAPTRYEFRYITGVEPNVKLSSTQQTDYPLLNSNSLYVPELSKTLFPLGNPKDNFGIKLQIRIFNKFEAYTELTNIRITVVEPKITDSSATAEALFGSLLESKPERNDIQTLSPFIAASMSLVNEQAKQKNQVTASIETDYTNQISPYELEKVKKEKEEFKKQQQKYVSKMVNLLKETNATTLQELKSVGDALTLTTNDPNGLDTNSLTDAIDIVENMANVLGKILSSEKIGADYLDQNSKSLASSISNLLLGTTKEHEEAVSGHSNVQNKSTKMQVQQTKAKTESLVKSLSKYLNAISSNKVPGELPSIGKTEMFSFSVQKVLAADLTHFNITTEKEDDQSGFTLPSSRDLFNNSVLRMELTVLSTVYKDNTFSWDPNSSSNIRSEVVSLSFESKDSKIDIQNTSKPIQIKIKNKPQNFDYENITLYMPGLTYPKIVEIKSIDCVMLINIQALNDIQNETNLIVYIQYGKPPGVKDHDVKLNISNSNKMELIRNIENVYLNKTSGNETQNQVNKIVNKTLDRFTNIRTIDSTTFIMWNFSASTYSYTNDQNLYFAFEYEGPMPKNVLRDNIYTYDILETRGSFNYSLKAFCTECRYWNEATDQWKSDGCQLDLNETSLLVTACKCSHLTNFGGLYVAPNPIATPSLARLKEGYVLLVAVATVLLLYVVGLLFARRADRIDSTKIGVTPLLDNRPEDRYLYEIIVNTGSRRNAGTTSNVFFTAAGDEGESGFRRLKDSERQTFQRASSDIFVMATEKSLGDLTYIRIWHDNSGGGWYLRSLEVTDLQTEEKFIFCASRWLAVDQHDGQLDCIIPVSTLEDQKEFNYIFTNKTRRDFSDAHIWFSIYARPPRSSFTRCQRLSVAMSLLFSAMVANLMFYKALPEGVPADQNKIGNFSFSWKQVYIALISACITAPVNLILVGIFRSVRPAGKKILQASSEECFSDESFELTPVSSPTEEKLVSKTESNKSKKASVHLMVESIRPPSKHTNNSKKSGAGVKVKEPFYLPHWFIYPAWSLCVLVILGCAVIVVLYGMTFGNKKSLEWLASVTICLIQDILLLQPLKVFAMALFIALIVKKLDEEERSEVEKQVKSLAQNEEWVHSLVNEISIFDRVDTPNPPEADKIESMRALRLKEVKMHAITRELILYLIFTLIVFMIGYLTRDQFSYRQTRDIEELLRLKIRNEKTNFTKNTVFKKLVSYNDFWPWMDLLFLDQLYPEKWYTDSKEENFPGKLYINDLNTKVLNGVRLRQVRVKPDSCTKNDDIKKYVSIDCSDSYSPGSEETRHFGFNWSFPIEPQGPLTSVNKPWRYQTWQELDAYPIWAELGTYYGGGYVVELFPKWNNSLAISKLKSMRWIDRHTRALIIEMTLYNPATNYFDSVFIVFEYPPSGGMIPFYSVITFKLYRYTSGYAFVTICCEILFLLFMILFMIREMRLIYRQRASYFGEFWNLVEISNFILSILAIVFYFYREKLAKDLIGRVPEKSPEKFINFQFAANWDLTFTYIIALICFFVTLKFIKLLRFNRRISMLSSTLKAAWYPLAMFGILFSIVITAVVCSTTIIFGGTLYGYRNIFKTVASIISLLLGKFSYSQFETTNRVLGPMFFFSFNIMVNWIIMNMMISILNDVFAVVQVDISKQDNDYEMVDFIMDHFKSWIGMSGHKEKTVAEDAWEKAHSSRQTSGTASAASSRMLIRKRKNRAASNTYIDTDPEEAKFMNGRGELKKNLPYDECDDYFHDRDLSFLNPNEVVMDDDEINKTVDKFINCVNTLYFDDNIVAAKMNTIISKEIQC